MSHDIICQNPDGVILFFKHARIGLTSFGWLGNLAATLDVKESWFYSMYSAIRHQYKLQMQTLSTEAHFLNILGTTKLKLGTNL